MAQEKMPEAGAGTGLEIMGGAAPEAAVSAYGGIGVANAVRLAEGRPPCAAGYYGPVAVLSLQDLPDDLRRQLGGFQQVAPEGGAPYLLLVAGRPDSTESVRRQLSGDVHVNPPSYRTAYLAVGHGEGVRGVVSGNSDSEIRVLQLKEENGKMVYQLDTTPIPQLPEIMGGGGLFQLRNGFTTWVERSGDLCLDAAAFAREPGTPFFGESHLGKNRAAGLSLGALYSEGLAGENAVPFVFHNRATEQGALYYDGLAPPLENVMAQLPCLYAVQVRVDAAVGDLAGDPLAPGDKAAGADTGREHRGSYNLSAVVGICAASTAVTAVAAGAFGPVLAFGFFMVFLGGVSLAMASVRAPNDGIVKSV